VKLNADYEVPLELPASLESHLTQANWDVLRRGIQDIVKEHASSCKVIQEKHRRRFHKLVAGLLCGALVTLPFVVSNSELFFVSGSLWGLASVTLGTIFAPSIASIDDWRAALKKATHKLNALLFTMSRDVQVHWAGESEITFWYDM